MSNKETAMARVITIRLRIPALVVAALLFAGGLVWAFVLGIMVGRGQIDDELAALMPANRAEATAQDETDKALAELEDLIKAEDLKFQESLRQNQDAALGALAGVPAASLPSAQAQQAGQANAPSGTARQEQAQNNPPAAPVQSGGQQYKYVYQVASYSKAEQAREMQGRMQSRGIDAEVETKIIQGSAKHRVLIRFQGNADAVSQMQNLLKKEFKINEILPRGKTPLAG